MPGINIRQLSLGPNIPLARRGCKIEFQIKYGSKEFWSDTHFEKAFLYLHEKPPEYTYKDLEYFMLNKLPQFISILRKIDLKNQLDSDLKTENLLNEMKKYKLINENNKPDYRLEQLGNLFECLVTKALNELSIEASRDLKIIYPYDSQKYDSDGQKYDVIGALDLSRFIWIECKKPLYLNEENGLSNVLSPKKIEAFLRRAHFLRPSIAMYFVDTKDDYRETIRTLFSNELLNSNLLTITNRSDSQIMARFNGFIYFTRLIYQNDVDYWDKLKQSINQVLHDSRNEYKTENFIPGYIKK